MTAFKRLRKHRRTVAGVLLPVLAFVWLGAAASPCLMMGTSSMMGMSSMMGTSSPALVPAAHNGHDHDHGHHLGASHDDGLHYRCPHCPFGGAHSAAHIACSTLASFADETPKPAVPSSPDLKHVLPSADVVSLQAGQTAADAPLGVAPLRVPLPAVPLNLRYCVFLN